jgi:hypothetical protein
LRAVTILSSFDGIAHGAGDPPYQILLVVPFVRFEKRDPDERDQRQDKTKTKESEKITKNDTKLRICHNFALWVDEIPSLKC